MYKNPIFICFALFLLSACASSKKPPSHVATLFTQIGGMQTIEPLVQKLVVRLKQHQQIVFLFEKTNEEDFQALLIAQICMETGGNCQYTGLSMPEAHSGMAINTREFDIFVDVLIKTMTDVGISYTHQNKLLAIFAPMRKDVIDQ